MTTVAQLIDASLRLLTEIGTGENASASEYADALFVLNDMTDQWSLDGLMVYARTTINFNLVGGQSVYTIGPSGTIVAQRPNDIQSGYTTLGGAPGAPVSYPFIVIDADEFNRIPLKSQSASFPEMLYYEPTYPNGTMTFWGVPIQAMPANITTTTNFSPFATTADTIIYPPGYGKLFRYQLAVELAAEYGIPVPPQVMKTYQETAASVKSKNRPVNVMSFEGMLRGRNNNNIWPFA